MVDDISQFKFPILTPYPGQVELMQQLYQNLQHPSSKLCMVESPTGTGKTLSTLCSILAYLDSYYGLGNEKENKISEINEEEDFVKWLKTQESYHSQHKKAKIAIENSQIHQKARKRILLGKNGIEPEEIGEDERCRIQKIFICSRTHSQLSQILKEFNRTDFKRNYSISVCGSRSQFCINSDLKNCKSDLELSERCKEAVKFSRCGHFNQENIEKSKFEILNSLDDIEDLMKSEKNAKFSPCPFYSLNRAAEESDVVLMTYSHLFMNLVNFEQGIVIIDESHNIEDALAGLFSNSLNRAYLQEIISSLDSYWKKFGNKMKESSILILKKFKILSFKVLALLNSYKSKNSTILQAAEFASSIDFDLKTALDIVCEAVDSKLLQKLHSFGDFTNKNIFQIQTFFSNLLNYHSLGVLAISESSLSFHLLDFKELLHKIVSKSKLTILMAGTLTPFDATLSCLKSDFNSTLLSYGHVIDKKRAFISALSSFVITEKTKSHHLCKNIGEMIIKVVSKIPEGVVCFFQSKQTESFFLKCWKECYIFSQLDSIKKIFLSSEFEDYKKYLKNTGPALLLAVCGGSLSEGIDFKDGLCRGAFIIGMPFPDISDRIVNIRMDNQLKRINSSKFNLFENKCMKTVNQAIGRVFRHSQDFGAVILVDKRFTNPRVKNKLSQWMLNSYKEHSNSEQLEIDVERFFTNFSS